MIVIPMAGLSRRFTEAGYGRPKYMLDLHGRSLFAHAINSFRAYFETLPFLFIARDIMGTADFLRRECGALGIVDGRFVMLDGPTAGQAETVELGVDRSSVSADETLSIFNIDTFRPGFIFPRGVWMERSAGYLEVFRGDGPNWSYVRAASGDEPRVLETAEKQPISDLCCTGLYHFATARDFRAALASERAAPSSPELYVAPIYNHLISSGKLIHYDLISAEKVIFCGVPEEYEALRNSPPNCLGK
jgi:hypothetical protein